jgi:hypothetical protein
LPYSVKIPTINQNDLMLYLNPKGKSNEAVDRNVWVDETGAHKAKLNGFYYGVTNGWMQDKDGVNYLQFSSGASLTLNGFDPFEKDPTIKIGNDNSLGRGLTIELDFEISGVTDYSKDLIKCISINNAGTIKSGFKITGDTAKFYSSTLNDSLDKNGETVGALATTRVIEN